MALGGPFVMTQILIPSAQLSNDSWNSGAATTGLHAYIDEGFPFAGTPDAIGDGTHSGVDPGPKWISFSLAPLGGGGIGPVPAGDGTLRFKAGIDPNRSSLHIQLREGATTHYAGEWWLANGFPGAGQYDISETIPSAALQAVTDWNAAELWLGAEWIGPAGTFPGTVVFDGVELEVPGSVVSTPVFPGRGAVVRITTRDSRQIGLGRGVFGTDGVWYAPLLVSDVTLRTAVPEPLSRVPQTDVSPIEFADPEPDSTYFDVLSDPDTLEGALVEIFIETGGTFDTSADLLWTGYVRKVGGASHDGLRTRLQVVDPVGFYVGDKTIGPKLTANDVGDDSVLTDDTSLIYHADGETLPIIFGSFVTGATYIRHVPIDDDGTETQYAYHDTEDASGDEMTGVAITGDRVWLIDTKDPAWTGEIHTAMSQELDAVAGTVPPVHRLVKGTEWSQSSAEADSGQISINKTNVTTYLKAATDSEGNAVIGGGDSWDSVEGPKRFIVVSKATGPTSDDSTVTTAYTPDHGSAVSNMIRLLVEYGDFPASLLDMTDAASLDSSQPKVRRMIWRGTERIAEAVAAIEDEAGLRRIIAKDGTLSWEAVDYSSPPSSRFTIYPRHIIKGGGPKHTSKRWGPYFNTITGSRDHTLKDAPDKLLQRRPKQEDSSAITANDGERVNHHMEFRWIWDTSAMDDQMTVYLENIGPKSDLVTVEVRLDDEDLETQLRTRGGDRISFSSTDGDFNERFQGAWWVAAARHNVSRSTSEFTLWRVPSS